MPVRPNNLMRLHFIVFLWGFTGILGALISLEALELVFYRMGLAAAILWVWAFWKKKELRIGFTQLSMYLLTGAVIAVHWVTFFHAIKVSNVSVTLACLSSVAVFVSLIEPLVYKRRVRMQEILLSLLGVLGLFLIFQFEGDHREGILYALISAFLAAVFSVLNGKFVQSDASEKISVYELSGGWLVLTVYLLLNGSFQNGPPALQGFDLLWLFILGGICTAYAFIVSVDVMKELSPFTTVLTINLEPVYGIILAQLLFHEKESMTPYFYLGTGIILSSVILNGYLNRKRRIRQRIETEI